MNVLAQCPSAEKAFAVTKRSHSDLTAEGTDKMALIGKSKFGRDGALGHASSKERLSFLDAAMILERMWR
ncbi:hypothetical protein VE25_01785 [Devosia geojensis]|uniref:Uncharacterized protein n=1 Tax=Devosia geojensis TaxID=443610 RepID=A0A0F5FXB5_9HYPH|nr:hypothetical protein VE25_01785 [Devosia geojensis]